MSKTKKAVATVQKQQKAGAKVAAPTAHQAEPNFSFSRQQSNHCGCTLSASREGNAIADLMATKPGVRVTKFPALIRIDGDKMIEFNMAEIAEALGLEPDEYGPYDFEIELSTHYGRQVRLDDRVLLFANPEDAAEYLGFDLQASAAS